MKCWLKGMIRYMSQYIYDNTYQNSKIGIIMEWLVHSFIA